MKVEKYVCDATGNEKDREELKMIPVVTVNTKERLLEVDLSNWLVDSVERKVMDEVSDDPYELDLLYVTSTTLMGNNVRPNIDVIAAEFKPYDLDCRVDSVTVDRKKFMSRDIEGYRNIQDAVALRLSEHYDHIETPEDHEN